MAIGRLRNTSDSITRLSYTPEYGARLGKKLKDALDAKPSWVDDTCEAIGTNDEEERQRAWNQFGPQQKRLLK